MRHLFRKHQSTISFLKQSSWLVIATCVGSLFMILVHTVARRMKAQEYSDLFILLRLLLLLGVPGAALQAAFASEAATALTELARHELVATLRKVFLLILAIWGTIVGFVAPNIQSISSGLQVSHPHALLLVAMMGLTASYLPILKGLLQGMHKFSSLGCMHILEGAFRFFGVTFAVLFLHRQSTAAIAAVGVAQLSVVFMGAWLTRNLWLITPSVRAQPSEWFRKTISIGTALAAAWLMCNLDVFFVKNAFTDENQKVLYQGAAMCAFALMQFTNPISSVMFARVSRLERSNQASQELPIALLALATLASLIAVGYTLLPQLPLKIIYSKSPEMWQAFRLVPWFGWMIFPAILSTPLVYSILARRRNEALPWLLLVTLLYESALWIQKPTLLTLPSFEAFKRVLQTLGAANLLFFVVALWFNRGQITLRKVR
jgi:hypothetical protein